MKIVLFTKMLQKLDVQGLVTLGKQLGIDGYDLCVRDDFPVNPDNVAVELPRTARQLKDHGLPVRMITGPGLLFDPNDPVSERLVLAMADAGVPILKIGYDVYHILKDGDYPTRAEQFKKALAGWQQLAEKYGVKICYHTHGGDAHCVPMGCSAAALRHLMAQTDPQYIGAYLDPGNMLMSGEPYELAFQMVQDRLMLVGVKDTFISREDMGDQGRATIEVVAAGKGMVPWSSVFEELVRINFSGLLVIHCEFKADGPEDFDRLLRREVQYFLQKRTQSYGVST